jgi:hypothetical protein
MKPKGRRIAIVAVVLGLVTIVLTAYFLRERIEEGWYSFRLRTGDMDAKETSYKWMSENGWEDSLSALMEAWLSDDPSPILLTGSSKAPRPFGDALMLAIDRINERMGENRSRVFFVNSLAPRTGFPRLCVFHARTAVRHGSSMGIEPDIISLAIRRLGEGLSDPDPIVRAGAAYGLMDVGKPAQGYMKTIEVLRSDSDPRVREAAFFALMHLREVTVPEGKGRG